MVFQKLTKGIMKIIIPEKPRENLDQTLRNTEPKIASILDKSLNNYDFIKFGMHRCWEWRPFPMLVNCAVLLAN